MPAISSANGLPSNSPLPSSVVASSAPELLGEGFERGFGARPDRAAPADDDRPFGLGDHRDDFVDHRRVGPQQLRPRHQVGRRRVVGQIGKFLLLQIERHAEHHRLALGAGDVKSLAHAIERPIDRADRHKMRAGRQRQRRLIDRLNVPGGADRGVAGKHHNRRVAARRHRQRRHDLGIARAAGHRGDADLAGSAGIGVGHRNAAMLVAGVDQPDLLVVGHRGRPVHVGVAHQGEERVDPLGGKGLRQDVRNLVVAHCASLFPKKICRSHETKARHRILPPLSSGATAVICCSSSCCGAALSLSPPG